MQTVRWLPQLIGHLYMNNFIKSPWLLWLLVSCIGSAIGFTLGNLATISGPDYYFPLYLLVEISLVGLLIGFGQWMILRTKLKRSWLWIPATTIGLPLGFFIGFFASDLLLVLCQAMVHIVFQS